MFGIQKLQRGLNLMGGSINMDKIKKKIKYTIKRDMKRSKFDDKNQMSATESDVDCGEQFNKTDLSRYIWFFFVCYNSMSLLFLLGKLFTSVFEIRGNNHCGRGIFEHYQPESMLKNYSSTVIISSYFKHCTYVSGLISLSLHIFFRFNQFLLFLLKENERQKKFLNYLLLICVSSSSLDA